MPEPVEPGLRLVPVDEVTARRRSRASADYTGIAEREASALLAEHAPRTPAELHTVVTLAWLTGCMAGTARTLAMLGGSVPPETAPTTEGN